MGNMKRIAVGLVAGAGLSAGLLVAGAVPAVAAGLAEGECSRENPCSLERADELHPFEGTVRDAPEGASEAELDEYYLWFEMEGGSTDPEWMPDWRELTPRASDECVYENPCDWEWYSKRSDGEPHLSTLEMLVQMGECWDGDCWVSVDGERQQVTVEGSRVTGVSTWAGDGYANGLIPSTISLGTPDPGAEGVRVGTVSEGAGTVSTVSTVSTTEGIAPLTEIVRASSVSDESGVSRSLLREIRERGLGVVPTAEMRKADSTGTGLEWKWNYTVGAAGVLLAAGGGLVLLSRPERVDEA